jgi:hypothetical protein
MFLTPEPKKTFSRTISIPYHPKISKNICKSFEQHNIRVVESSARYKIKNRLHSTKMPVPEGEKSGIYEISCKTQRCGYKYIGQSRRQIQKRFIEHLRAFKNNKTTDSAIAQHMLTKDDRPRTYKHNFDHSCLKLLKRMEDPNKLDALESIYIQRDTSGKLMNMDEGPLKSSLFDII